MCLHVSVCDDGLTLIFVYRGESVYSRDIHLTDHARVCECLCASVCASARACVCVHVRENWKEHALYLCADLFKQSYLLSDTLKEFKFLQVQVSVSGINNLSHETR